MLLIQPAKSIFEILKEFIPACPLVHAMVRTHHARRIEIDARRMEIMLRQMRTGTNYVSIGVGDVGLYGDRRIDRLEALDVMLELTKAQPGFYQKTDCMNQFLLRFTGTRGEPDIFSAWHGWDAIIIATVPAWKSGSSDLPKAIP